MTISVNVRGRAARTANDAPPSVGTSSGGTAWRGVGRAFIAGAGRRGEALEQAIERPLARPVEERDEEERTPEDVVLEAGVAQVGVGHHRHDVEREEPERGEARAESHRKQRRQHEFRRRAERGGHGGREQGDPVLVLEQRERDVPVLDLGETGQQEHARHVEANGEREQRLEAIDDARGGGEQRGDARRR